MDLFLVACLTHGAKDSTGYQRHIFPCLFAKRLSSDVLPYWRAGEKFSRVVHCTEPGENDFDLASRQPVEFGADQVLCHPLKPLGV